MNDPAENHRRREALLAELRNIREIVDALRGYCHSPRALLLLLADLHVQLHELDRKGGAE